MKRRANSSKTTTLPNFFCIACFFFLLASSARAAAPVYGYKVIARYPHSTASYTEGFFYLGGLFYEGTGLKGHSEVQAIEPKSGTIVRRRAIGGEYFGEGIIDWGSYLYEWTWQSNVCFVYDRLTFAPVKQFSYTGEGWGMTRTDAELITSDGTATLRFRKPGTFEETRHILVTDDDKPVPLLNELEYVKGEIYANVWHSDRIARIAPADGRVIGWIDLTGLLPDNEKINDESVLNGIAFDAPRNRLFVTGKQWPWIFEIQVLPQ